MFTITSERKAVTDEIELRRAEVFSFFFNIRTVRAYYYIATTLSNKNRKIKITISEHSICPEFQHQVSFTVI